MATGDPNDMVYFGPMDGDKPLYLARVCNDGYEIGIAYSHSDHMQIMFSKQEMRELLPFIRAWLDNPNGERSW